MTGALVKPVPATVTAPSPGQPATQASRGTPLPAAIGSKTLIAAAEGGDVSAAFEVATRYSDGRGVPLNPEAAAIWFERASNGGVVPAMFRLGGLYEQGIGVMKDLNKDLREIRKQENRDKDHLETWITVLNLLVIPVLIILFGVTLAYKRHILQAAK